MHAKSLEAFLRRSFASAELGREPHDSFQERFKAMRACGRLPQDRENRQQLLSDQQIAFAILGAVAGQPKWAGFEAICLSKLRPAGGVSASFYNAETLLDAVVIILNSDDARRAISRVTLSCSEWGTNSHGYAFIEYQKNDGVFESAYFVSQMSFSLFQPGAEAELDPFPRYALVSKEIVLSKHFFRELAREVDFERSMPTSAGDGEEYSEEEKEQARRKRLGVRPNSKYLNIGVDAHVVWPKEEVLIKFDRYELVLMPRTKENAASIHIDLNKFRLNEDQGRTVMNRFLSLMAWVDDHYAIAQDGWSGNPVPVGVPKRELAFLTTYHWFFDRHIPSTEMAQRALALYREARNAQFNYFVSYAVLNYYKIIEIKFPEGQQARSWIAANFPKIEPKLDNFESSSFAAARGTMSPEQYIYKACRLAVAHASVKTPSDPDEKTEILRLHAAAHVMRWLARLFISDELNIDSGWVEKLMS